VSGEWFWDVMLCWVSGSGMWCCVGWVVLWCDIVLGEWFPTSEENAVPSPSRVKQSKFLDDIRNHSTKDTVSYPRR